MNKLYAVAGKRGREMNRPEEKKKLVLFAVMISFFGGIISGIGYYFLHTKLFRRRAL
jgi:hypothetical protein